MYTFIYLATSLYLVPLLAYTSYYAAGNVIGLLVFGIAGGWRIRMLRLPVPISRS
jgi:hypothetical protein